jgi:DNA polymerase III subunit beta
VRLSVLQENFSKGLSIVGRAVTSRSTLPVLSNILLSTDADRLKLAATNLEIGVSCWLGAQVEDEGAITLPARLLADWVNSVPPEKIQMEMVVRTMSVNFKCARFDSNIKGIDSSEFPLIPTADGENTLMLPAPTLRRIIDQVVFAAADAKETSRPALTGVQVHFEGERLTLAATDGYRLSLRRTTMAGPLQDLPPIIVPARSLAEVSRIVGEADPDKPVELSIAGARNQILFRMAGKGESQGGGFHQVDLVSQLIDAKFPDFNAIIPKTHVTRTVLDTSAFVRALKVASLFARDASDRVTLQIAPGSDTVPGQITIKATSAESGDNVSEVDALVEGGPLEIAFNARYLIEVLSVIDTPQVVLETTRPDRPGVFHPLGAGPEEFTHVIMPMQLTR